MPPSLHALVAISNKPRLDMKNLFRRLTKALHRIMRHPEQKDGHPDEQFQLGLKYESGTGVAQDYAQAAHWYRKAAMQGHALSQNALGWIYMNGLGVAQDDVNAVEWWRKAAEQGEAAAQSSLAFMYSTGRGVAQDDILAVAWWHKAAEQGFSIAQNWLGGMYESGRGVAHDDAQAASWWHRAAEQGHVVAQTNLGGMFRLGRGVAQSDAQAVAWWRKAAEQGHSEAQSNLADMYAAGLTVDRDAVQAAVLWRKAAEQGNVVAQASLGACYATGDGVPQDDTQAAVWWRKAAEQGHAISQANLGCLYMDGRGIAQDEAQAAIWWHKAAEQGNKLAESNLDALHILQQGSITEGVEWLHDAAAMGDTEALDALKFGERHPAVGGIESVVLDGKTYFFGFDFKSDLVLSPLFDDIDAMAAYASLHMRQTDGEHDVAYWRELASDAIEESELSPSLESRTFSSHALALIREQLRHACQSNSTVPGFSIEYHLLYLLEAAGRWEADRGDIEGDIHIIAGERPLAEGENIGQVSQRLQAQLRELVDLVPGNWSVLFSALSSD
ncbi:TPA: SEL1-like repeat protein [Pseudomonas aeruginosa]|nr:SEL1-like repeat protein [Pseudomonas aeruginosa]